MNRIRLLPEQVANQIAAGEVVERPASVVKELVENSLDAGARHIAVTVKNGGKSLVRVADDGTGMSRDDALLALERHATSKIQRAEDLSSIQSLGFRGEAIPSIASVSRFVLATRERGTLSGTQIEIAGGKIVSVRETGTAEGTTVEVRNLFFNLPARRKFLRSGETETAHIQHVVTLAALAHPEVAFRLAIDDREMFHLAPAAALLDRLRELYGADLCDQLVPVGDGGGRDSGRAAVQKTVSADNAPPGSTGCRISGLVGKPGASRADRSQQHIFVNGRPVDNRAVGFALREAYHTALMRGQFPITFLFIDLDPGAVDVNVHPAKREVRFRDEFAVRGAVTDAVRSALESRGGSPRPLPATVPSAGGWTPAAGAGPAPSSAVAGAVPLRLRGGEVRPGPSETGSLPMEGAGPVWSSAEPAGEIQTEAEGTWRILGSIGRLYVLAESPEGLVLIDQHAAHERVMYEKFLKDLGADAAPSQKLLLPVTLELEARDAAFLRGNLKTLHKLGLGVSEFGDRTWLVDAVPPDFPLENLPQTFRNIVDELRRSGEQVHARRLSEDKIATAVCRHAVKAHDPLKGRELVGLLQQLHRCELPYTCPHGRPTMIQISYAELEKKFGRRA